MMTIIQRLMLSALLLVVLLSAGVQVRSLAAKPGPVSDAQLLQQLHQATSGKARISLHDATGKARFIGTTQDRVIQPTIALRADTSPEQAARSFLTTYGSLFGEPRQGQNLRLEQTHLLNDGRSVVRFQQTHAGIPVLGAELYVQMSRGKGVLSANGELQPPTPLPVVPTIAAAAARERALGAVAKAYDVNAATLQATQPQLWIYNSALLGSPGRAIPTLVWRMEVTADELTPIRELVLIDAHLGNVALNFNQINGARSRYVCDRNNSLGGAITCAIGEANRSEGQDATNNPDIDRAYDYAGTTYDYFATSFGRDSIDNAGLPLIATVRYCSNASPCPYQNAFWNGSQMVYGEGFAAADDVVAHELAHGFTQYTSGLFYYYQAGAINEALSDIFGEFTDLAFDGAYDNDTPGVRWLMGEDVPGIGALRSMKDPTTPPLLGERPSPDRMTSVHYWADTDEEDNGGVHYNSGVANKAAYLMTDGGTFNGRTITGLGLTKAGRIWYEVATTMLLSGSDYKDLYDYLQQACVNLTGQLNITAADCQQVKNVVDATEMDLNPTTAPTVEASMCEPGQVVKSVFFDNMENPASGNWTSSAQQGENQWFYPQNINPHDFDATYAASGKYNLWGYNNGGSESNPSPPGDFSIRTTNGIKLPAEAYMHFKHAYGFEDNGSGDTAMRYDGGIVEYSTNGITWIDAAPLFTHGGYNGSITTTQDNPLKGRSAFTAESNGYMSSRLNLAALAGKNVLFRFRMGTDSIYDDYGWFIDDVSIHTCVAPLNLSIQAYLPMAHK